ncbi:MAG: hypothetical protein D6737_16135 [Chloroflexi bacterium]|nr:MAG: hypothetical protein D6737_16135 [Chloroflexota bacterium]
MRGVVSDALAVQESRLYAPYGQPFGVTGTSQTDFGFTGEWTDDNDLVHLRARYLPSIFTPSKNSEDFHTINLNITVY